MIISIASGKGGTGKTTVATNLVFSIGKRAKLLDCDVEEPNAHLFLKPEIDETEKKFRYVPHADIEKCTFCGRCQEVCRFSAIVPAVNEIIVFPELCHSCGGCIIACPENALVERERYIGDIKRGKAFPVIFSGGRLNLGEAMAPPMIKAVKNEIDEDFVNIIDSPPGTSCPAIASVRNSDFVVLVTEPTPFGLHDLKLAFETVKILGIPAGIVVNRSDFSDSSVREYAKKENIPVLMEIPFDRQIAEIYSSGNLISEKLPEYKNKFLDLYENIKNLLSSREALS